MTIKCYGVWRQKIHMAWPFCLGNFQKAFVLFMFLTNFLKKIGLVDEERVPRSGKEKYEWEILEIRKESVGNSWRLTEKKTSQKL